MLAVSKKTKRKRYPFFYPRDAYAFVRFYCHMLEDFPQYKDEILEILFKIAEFIFYIADKNGMYFQRYDVKGKNRAIYKQEDATACALLSLCLIVEFIPELKEKLKKLLIKSFNCIYDQIFDASIGLFTSTTSAQESSIEYGYTLWTNSAYIFLLQKVKSLFPDFSHPLISNLNRIIHTFKSLLILDNRRFLRRITLKGERDFNFDASMIAPIIFPFEIDIDKKIYTRTFEEMLTILWDPELGGIMRYHPFIHDADFHNHAGNGPWMQYTAILAQFFFAEKDFEKAQKLISCIEKYKTERGDIAEHLTTVERFEYFWKKEWETGLDFKKEFDERILLPEITFSQILKETINMYKNYLQIKNKIKKSEDKIIVFSSPLMWAHSEYAIALIQKKRGNFKNEKIS